MRFRRGLFALLAFLPLAVRAETTDPTAAWQLQYETGSLWRFTGMATQQDYVFLPQMLTLVGPANLHRSLAGGDLVVRPRFSLLAEPIVRGPEHHYFGGAASGLVEWWNAPHRRAWFLTAGGGLGWLDAHGYQIAGGQATRFELNWLVYGGARWRIAPRWLASAGIYFQHVSNGHITKLDPGVNGLGPMFGIDRAF